MMKVTPRVPVANQPTTMARIAATTTAMSSCSGAASIPLRVPTSATTYAPTPKNAAWPIDTRPVKPISRSRLATSSPMTRMSVASPVW